jgi:alpha-L-fucosidase
LTPTSGGDWWDEARFGLFVHWGVMSLLARGDWSMHREHIPIADYERLGDRFTASTWDPPAQAALARRAGMRYGVLVTRHHDGFCLWDTATDSFKATNTPAGRDLVSEWVDAFRAAGLRAGLYYSLLDWRAPAYWRGHYEDPEGWAGFRDHVHAQIRELLTGYGEIATLWYDGFWPHAGEAWGSLELEAMARELQPGILINDRSGIPGDFATPEQSIGVIPPFGRWEACLTTNDYWGWHADDHNWKSAARIVRTLVQCASGGGNLLLNVGPDPEGAVPSPAVGLLEAVGAWLRVNGDSVYGTMRSPAREALSPLLRLAGGALDHARLAREPRLRRPAARRRHRGGRRPARRHRHRARAPRVRARSGGHRDRGRLRRRPRRTPRRLRLVGGRRRVLRALSGGCGI